MKRRGFLKMLGIGAAVPVVAQLPAVAALIEQEVYEEPHTPTPEYIRSQGELSLIAGKSVQYVCMTAYTSPALVNWVDWT